MEEASKDFNKQLTDFYADIPWPILPDHIHHGFYHEEFVTVIDQEAAEVHMVDQLLQFADVPEDELKKPKNIIDVGCGFGGGTIQIGKKYGAKCIGINIIPSQIQRANEVSIAKGLEHQFKFQVGDALQLPFPDKHFDLVWSLECGEHLQDKAKFVSELVRVAAPGGTIIIASTLIRDLSPNEESLKAEEKEFLRKMSESIPLRKWISCMGHVDLFKSHSVKNLKFADWTKHTQPYVENLGIEGFNYFAEGHKMGLLKYTVITCKKPE